MDDKHYQLRFPFWQFLNQPLFDPTLPLILNPNLFWQRYQIAHLERCWSRTFRPEEKYRN